MKKRKFLVPRQAADAGGSNVKSPAAVEAAAAAPPPPETIFKRSKPALQLFRPGAITADKPRKSLIEKTSINDKTEAKDAAPETTITKAKEAKTLLSRNLSSCPPAPLPVAAADASAVAPAARVQRRAFRIPTLPPDALPSLSALLLFENLSISCLLARTIQKAPVPDDGSLFPKLASFESEALSQAAAELLDGILPSYYEVEQKENEALYGVIFGLPSDKTLRTYSQVVMDPVPRFQEKESHSYSAPIPLLGAAVPKKKSVLEEQGNIAAAAAAAAKNTTRTAQVFQVPAYSDSQGASIISSAVWVPTPGGGGGKENNFLSEARLRRSLAEDTEIPLSFLKSLVFP
ncbi:hypothetical protein Ndes2526B_g07350 [Nannochloris sp. 'desiccata']